MSHVEALDETVSLARAKLDLSTGRAHIGGPGPARAAGLLLSAYLAGVAEGALTLAVTYAKLREQFGQPIGSFQAIKHYCAEMARRAEAAVAQTFYATLDSTTRRDDDMFEVAAAVRPQLSPWHRQRRPAKFVEPGHRRHKFSAERNFKYLRARRQGDVLVQTSSGQCRYLSAGLQEPECAVLQCALAGRPGGERSASGLHADSAADLRSGRAHPRFRSRGDLPGEEILVDRCFGRLRPWQFLPSSRVPCRDGNGNGVPDNITNSAIQAASDAAAPGPGALTQAKPVAFCAGGGSTTTFPDWNVTGQSEWSLPISNDKSLYLRGLVTYTPANNNSPTTFRPSDYFLLNLFAGVRFGDRVDIGLFARNVLGVNTHLTRSDTVEAGLAGLPATGYHRATLTPRVRSVSPCAHASGPIDAHVIP